MSDTLQEVYRQHRTSQDKYVYFLLAAAGAGIALAVQRTTGLPLHWTMLPLGGAIICWAASFFCGCRHVNYVNAAMYANMGFLQLQRGEYRQQPSDPEYLEAAMSGVAQAAESHSNRGSAYAQWQFRLLAIGAALFVAWHVADMARLTFASKAPTAEPVAIPTPDMPRLPDAPKDDTSKPTDQPSTAP
jgi:hypothetical protein